MTAPNPYRGTAKLMRWTGRIITTLMALFMLFDGVIKIIKIQAVVEGTVKAGYPEYTIRWIGIAALVSAILYVIPRTAVLGAILLTGYLGGAIATHVRLGDSNWFFAFIFGVVAWLGIYLRDERLRRLIPIRSEP